jgi:diguanylate cyclase
MALSQKRVLGISPRGWRSLALWTGVGTAGCLAFSVTFAFLVFRGLDDTAFARGIAISIMLPILLAGPLFFFHTLKMRELARLNHMLHDMATKDHVTGLLNRRALISHIAEITGRMGRAGVSSHLFLVLDADRFKQINDRYGHQAGDEALHQMAQALRSSIRAHDVVGRLGGEEFGVLLLNVTNEDAMYVADRLRRAVASLDFRPLRERHDLSVSFGGVVFHDDLPFSQLFRAADANLYQAKHDGRNRGVITAYGEEAARPALGVSATTPRTAAAVTEVVDFGAPESPSRLLPGPA